MTTQPTTPAARPCVWPDCLTPAQRDELAAQVTAAEHGQHRDAMPDQRPICGCDEATGVDGGDAPANETGASVGATTPAPVDPALAQRIAAVIRHALKTLTAPALTDYAGRPISGTEIGLTEHDLAAVVLAELAPELTRAERLENAALRKAADDLWALANRTTERGAGVLWAADWLRQRTTALTGPAEDTP